MEQDRSVETQSPARLLHLLAVIATITNDAADVDDAFPRALEEICRFAGWPVGRACLITGDGRPTHHIWHVDPRREVPGSESLRAELEDAARGEGLVERVLATGAPVVIEDLAADSELACGQVAAGMGLCSAIAVPVRVGADVVAVLGIYSTERISNGSDLVELLQTVGVQLVRMIERARSIELVQLEQARQRLFFESSSDAVFMVDASARVTDVNPAACRLLSRSPSELIGMTPAGFAAPEWADVVRRSVEAKIQGERESSRYEYVVVDAAGNRIPVEVTSTALRAGDAIVGVHALIRDLREQRRAERALRESDERFRGAFEAAPIGMALASPDGRWLRVNSALCDMVGYTADELLVMSFQDITYLDDLEDDLAIGRRMLDGEFDSYQLDKRYVRKDGSIFWIHLSVSLVCDDDGAPAYSVAQILDIDERKRRELEAEGLRSRHPIAGSLSPREREVLELLAEGKTSAEVAVVLGVAEETVQTHVRRSMTKLDARSRTQAVASAIRLGWLDNEQATTT